MIVTRGLGPGGLLPTAGLGPYVIILGDVVQGLVAAFFGVCAALNSPVQLAALDVQGASLQVHMTMIEMLLEAGLIEDRGSIEEALRASVDVREALEADDGSPEVG